MFSLERNLEAGVGDFKCLKGWLIGEDLPDCFVFFRSISGKLSVKASE